MFFTLDNSYDDSIGHFPQSVEMGCGYNHLNTNSIKHVEFRKIPNFIPFTGCFVLHPKAKVTDFITAPIINSGFIISQKAKKVMEKFNLGKHAFFPTKISFENKIIENYFWFIVEPEDLRVYIDYQKTIFYLTDNDRNKIRKMDIKSEEMLLNIRKLINIGSENIDCDIIHFNSSFPKNLDIFELPVYDYAFHISKELANEFHINGISGISLNDTNRFHII